MHRFLFVSLGTIACMAIALAFSKHDEPAWRGERLSGWLQIGYGTGMTHGETDRNDADIAVRQIGIAALPYLVHELGAKHSHTRWRIVQLAQRQSLVPVSYRYPDERRSRAIGAFQALGKVATPVLPQLRYYLVDSELREDAQRAIDAILEIDSMNDD